MERRGRSWGWGWWGGEWHLKRFHRGEAKKSSLQNGEKVRKTAITDGNVEQKASVQPPKATNKGLQTPVALRRWGGELRLPPNSGRVNF